MLLFHCYNLPMVALAGRLYPGVVLIPDFMRVLETRIPPPIVMLLFGGSAWIANRYLPDFSFHLPFRKIIAAATVAVGVALNIYPKLAFGRVGTTVNPLKPGSATHLITSGIYRYTRNPMYLGQSVILLGWAAYLHNGAALFATPAFMLYILQFQIQPEERHLSARFPDEYAAFCARTPRWL